MSNEKSKYEIKLSIVATVLGILASIFVIIWAMVSVYDYLPAWLVYFVPIFIIGTILWILYDSISDFVKKKMIIRKRNILARKYFDDFEDLTDKFDEFLDPITHDNILRTLHNLSGSHEFRNISFLSTQGIHHLFDNFKERLKRFDGTKEDFSLLAREFDEILGTYNEFCICKPVDEIRRIGREKVEEPIKEEYRRQKETYGRFIGEYIKFGEKVNKKFGELRIFRTYFETPGEL